MSALLAVIALASATPTTVWCGAVERPGIAVRGPDGVWHGRAVDLCVAATKARFGPTARVKFHGYEASLAEANADQIAFLSPAEMAAVETKDMMRASPAIGYATQILLVPAGATFVRREDLARHLVCFIVGSTAEDAMDEWAVRDAVPIERLGFQEPDEMHDAFSSGKCAAMAIDAATEVNDTGLFAFKTERLGPPLEQFPIFAATHARTDPLWHDIVDRLVRSFYERGFDGIG